MKLLKNNTSFSIPSKTPSNSLFTKRERRLRLKFRIVAVFKTKFLNRDVPFPLKGGSGRVYYDMLNKYNIFFLFVICLLTACQSITKEDLYGEWRAVDLTEEGTPLDVNLSEISLRFDEQEYQFNSTLNYREAGSYYMQASLLVTKDTLQTNGVEKGIEISKLYQDSLFLRMNEDGKERRLVLVRR